MNRRFPILEVLYIFHNGFKYYIININRAWLVGWGGHILTSYLLPLKVVVATKDWTGESILFVRSEEHWMLENTLDNPLFVGVRSEQFQDTGTSPLGVEVNPGVFSGVLFLKELVIHAGVFLDHLRGDVEFPLLHVISQEVLLPAHGTSKSRGGKHDIMPLLTTEFATQLRVRFAVGRYETIHTHETHGMPARGHIHLFLDYPFLVAHLARRLCVVGV
jgi:hypothetical protein